MKLIPGKRSYFTLKSPSGITFTLNLTPLMRPNTIILTDKRSNRLGLYSIPMVYAPGTERLFVTSLLIGYLEFSLANQSPGFICYLRDLFVFSIDKICIIKDKTAWLW